jgi:hypothetical protein
VQLYGIPRYKIAYKNAQYGQLYGIPRTQRKENEVCGTTASHAKQMRQEGREKAPAGQETAIKSAATSILKPSKLKEA